MPSAAEPHSETAAPAACLNCGAALATPRPRFCGDCGQETTVRAPRLGEFIQQFGGAYFATEGAMWRTLRLLLFKPGELTRQYLAGRRKHYVLPLRLYLSISLIVLLAVRVTTTVNINADSAIELEPGMKGRQATVELGGGRAGMKDGVFFCENLPGWLCKRIQRRLDVDPRTMAREMAQVPERLVGNLGAAMFVLLPAFALALKGVYLNRRMHLTEHLVFALHLHAFWFIALALALPGLPFLTGLALLAMPVYALLATRRVYGGRWWPLLLRAALVSLLYGVTLVMVVSLLGLWTLLAQ